MAKLTVKINHQPFTLACDDGEEEMLKELAARFSARVEKLKAMAPAAPDNLLLVMAGLMAEDAASSAAAAGGDPAKLAEVKEALAGTMDDIAQRIERIAQELEAA